MRILNDQLQIHLAGQKTTLATLWVINRTDGERFFFTDHDQAITYDDNLYEASSGFDPTSIMNKADMSVDNMEVSGLLSSQAMSSDEIQQGLFDLAEIEISMINYDAPEDGIIVLLRGTLGRVKITGSQYSVEIRSLAQRLQQNIGRVYTPTCDAILGDTRCGLDLAPFTVSGEVTALTSNQVFSDGSLTQSAGYFSVGEIRWLTGNNAGLSMEVKSFLDSTVTLVLPMSNTIQLGDTYEIIAGCDKRKETCQARFSNLINFRGFPEVPGANEILKTAGTFRE